jgi:peptidyl-prolyl cis-trans isomerase C
MNATGRKWLLASTVAMVLMASALDCGKPHGAVARVGGQWIRQDQWMAYLGTHPASSQTDKQERLKGVVRREIAWIRGREAGLCTGPVWEEAAKKNREGLLGQFFLRQQKEMAPFTEAEAKQWYVAHSEERHVLHVLTATREEADLALVKLKRGEPFAQLARSVSKDPSAAINAGDLGWIRRDQVVQEFAEPAFSAAKGETVGPVHSQFGWHVIRVLDVRGPSDSDFDRDKPAIMARMENMRLQKRRAVALEPLRAKMPLQPDMAVLELDRTTVVAPGDEGRIAGRVAGGEITLKDLKEFIGGYMKSSGQSHSLGPATKRDFMEKLADDLRLGEAATQAGIDRRADFAAALWDSEREAALGVFARDFLARCAVGGSELSEFHATHPELFHGPGALHLNVLVANQMEAAQRAMLEASSGVPWASLVDKYGNKEATGEWDLGWVEASDIGKIIQKDILDAMLAGSPGGVYGPVQGPEGYEVLRVLERREGPLLPLDQCRDRVRAAYLEAKGGVILDAYLDGEGRKGISVKVYPVQ